MHEVNPVFFEKIKSIVLDSRARVYRVANSELLLSYWEIGRIIVEEEQSGELRAEYGKATLAKLSEFLTFEFGKGFDESNLRNMRAFFTAFPIRDALRHELSWTHYRLLIRVDDQEKKQYYLDEAIECNWNTRELKRQINSLSFERKISNSTPNKQKGLGDRFIKDPYVFEFLGLNSALKNREYSIEAAIIDHVQTFLLELGRGFAFVARQQHIVTDTSDFYIDLVFYNYLLKCFVIVDLKTTELTHQDIGQIDMYVRMYDDLKRGGEDNPTIGILLCTEKDETIVKYSVLNDNKNLYASKYLLYLPKEEELKALIEKDREFFESNNDQA